jgi:hypothetical protein
MLMAPFIIVGLVWFGISHLRHAHSPVQAASSGANPGAIGAGIAPSASAPPAGLLERVVPRRWRVAGVIAGLGGPLGDFAIVTDDERSYLVELASCRTSRFDIFCPTETGEFVSMRASSRPKVQGPLAQPKAGVGSVAEPAG